MSVTWLKTVYSAGARYRSTYVVACSEPDCWESVTKGVTGLPLPTPREARRVAAIKGWKVCPTEEQDGKDYCPEHREGHEEENDG